MAEEKVISRRTLLRGAGYSLAGLTLASSMGLFLSGCSQPEATVSPSEPDEPKAPEAPAYPWAYQKLDIAECQAAAYEKYMEAG